jgi:hypothetical protein
MRHTTCALPAVLNAWMCAVGHAEGLHTAAIRVAAPGDMLCIKGAIWIDSCDVLPEQEPWLQQCDQKYHTEL